MEDDIMWYYGNIALIVYKQKAHFKGPTFATTKAFFLNNYWFHIQIWIMSTNLMLEWQLIFEHRYLSLVQDCDSRLKHRDCQLSPKDEVRMCWGWCWRLRGWLLGHRIPYPEKYFVFNINVNKYIKSIISSIVDGQEETIFAIAKNLDYIYLLGCKALLIAICAITHFG